MNYKFKNKEQERFFNMLPIPDQYREEALMKLFEEQEKADKKKADKEATKK